MDEKWPSKIQNRFADAKGPKAARSEFCISKSTFMFKYGATEILSMMVVVVIVLQLMLTRVVAIFTIIFMTFVLVVLVIAILIILVAVVFGWVDGVAISLLVLLLILYLCCLRL